MRSAQSIQAAPIISTNAPIIDVFPPNLAFAAPPAGGASTAPVAETEEELPLRVPDGVVDAVRDDAADALDPLTLPVVNDAEGPIPLALTVLTAPVTVPRLLCTLATGTVLATPAELDLTLGVGLVKRLT
jgi:hypothetical protein